MEIKQNISLKPYNTFGVDVSSRKFVEVTSVKDLKQILVGNNDPVLILGGGSNILFTTNFDGLVIKNNIRGVDILEDNDDLVFLKVGAGEVWHDFVLFCIDNNYAGIENLSLIPGNVGAVPMQNIGAYGVEVKEVIIEVEAVDLRDFSTKIFSNDDCDLGLKNIYFSFKFNFEGVFYCFYDFFR